MVVLVIWAVVASGAPGTELSGTSPPAAGSAPTAELSAGVSAEEEMGKTPLLSAKGAAMAHARTTGRMILGLNIFEVHQKWRKSRNGKKRSSSQYILRILKGHLLFTKGLHILNIFRPAYPKSRSSGLAEGNAFAF